MESYAPRLAISYAEFEPVAQLWADMCQQMAVYEHESDASVNRTHVHLLMIGCQVKAEQFKRIFKKALPGIKASGNEFWKWESKYGTPDDNFLTYMSKGNLRPKFIKNFSDTIVEERRKQWKITTPSHNPSVKYDEYEVMKKQFFAEHDDYTLKLMQFEEVRKWVFHWYYKRDGRIPIASCYKRNAGSLNLARGEKIKKFEECSSEVFNLWY